MIWPFKKKEERRVARDRCELCARDIDDFDSAAEMSYMAVDDDGVLKKFTYGWMCRTCADALEKFESNTYDEDLPD